MKTLILLVCAAFFVLTSCDNNKDRDTDSTYVRESTTHETTVQEPAPAPQPATRDSVTPDGTTIKVNDEGIEIRSKNDDQQSNVNINSDSANVRINVPE